jgi:hypothetical protein
MNIQDQLQQLKRSSEEKKYESNLIAYIHYALIKEYGWIPLDEFKRLPIPTVLNLLNIAQERGRMEQMELDKMRRRTKHGR